MTEAHRGSRLEALALEGARAPGAARPGHSEAPRQPQSGRGGRRARARPVRGRLRAAPLGRRPGRAHREHLHRADRAARAGARRPRRAAAAASRSLLVWAWGEFRTSTGLLGYSTRGGVFVLVGRAGGLLLGAAQARHRGAAAGDAELAIARARPGRSNAELAPAVTRLEAFAEIARAVGGETELRTVLDRILEHGRAIVEARTLVVYLRTSDELRRSRAAATDGSPAGCPLARDRRRRPDRVGARRRASRASPSACAGRERRWARSAAAGPLEGGRFDEEAEELMGSVAASAATAVATAQSVARRPAPRARSQASEQARGALGARAPRRDAPGARGAADAAGLGAPLALRPSMSKGPSRTRSSRRGARS